MEEVATEPRAGWQWYEYASEGETATYELPAGSEATYEASLDDYTVTYTIAYPQTWRVRSDAYTHGRTIFQSPETNAEVDVFIRWGEGGADWFDHVRERWVRFLLPERPATPNTRFLGRDALFACSPPHPGLGTEAVLVFPDDENLIAISLHGSYNPSLTPELEGLEAEAAIYQAMLATFSLSSEPSVGDFALPDGAWCESYTETSRLQGTVDAVVSESDVIVLAEPAQGFVTVSLAEGGELVDTTGQPLEWQDIRPAIGFEAEGAAGEAGDYVAERITVQMSPR